MLEPSAKAIALDAYWERLADRSPVGHRASDVVYYLLFYEVVDDYVERRRAFREEHLGLARDAKERGELLLAGAFADPPDGAALVFRAEDDSVVREFVARDPYVREGLVKSWAIREWTVVVGDQ
ncbi:MAG TPA: YciI-like protein [Acidimicrobiales bacterium]|nr:YciI-like protein [Acidimicrobiales bacterium]